MPFEYIIDSAADLVVIHAIDQCDVPSFVRFMETVASDELFRPKTKILFDTSLGSTPSYDEAFSLIDVVTSSEIFIEHKTAILAAETGLYGINRMISSLSNLRGGTNLKVFISLSKAIEWLEPED